MAQEMEEFGLNHPDHRRVPWPDELKECSISLPQSLIQALAHNNPISLEQANFVHEFKKQMLQQVEFNRSKIQQLEEQIAQINHVNKGFQKQLFACDTTLSPFRHISNDIIYQISSHLPPIEWSDTCTPTSHSSSAVSQVSKSWRQTLHGVSNLWTTIHVNCSDWNSKPLEPLIDHVEHYSLLSASHSLTVQLDDNPSKDVYQKESNGLLRMLEWILTKWPSRYRLSRLRIRADTQNADVMRSCAEFGNQGLTLPNVESYLVLPWFSRLLSSEDFTMDEDGFITLSRAFPKLHSVWLGRRSFLLDAPYNFRSLHDGRSSLSYLRSLYLEHWMGYQDFIQFLKACPQLEEAWFEMGDETIDDDFSTVALSEPLIHRNMKELVLRISGFRYHILRLLTNLKFPALTSLQLHLADAELLDQEEGVPPDVADFMDTFPSLEILFFHDIQRVGSESFYELFSLFPIVRSITHLVFHGITLQHELRTIFDQAFGLSNPQLPLPRLQSLEVALPFNSTTFSGIGQSLETAIIDSLSRKDQHLSSTKVQLKILALPDISSTESTFIQNLTTWSEKVKTTLLLAEDTVLDATVDVEIVNPGDVIPNNDKKFEDTFMERFF